jgi:tetratricopeptide (TPR) repeat protein
MCNLLLFVATFCAVTAAPSHELKEYGNYDLQSAFSAVTAADGSQGYRIDAELIDQVVEDLASHAADYPPKFRTKEEQTRATRDATVLVELFEILARDDDAATVLLLKAAFVDRIAFNLDIKGAPEKAVHNYERALKREPDHPRANLSYGIFLAGTGALQKKSLPYLEKALKLGLGDARYTLGVVHLTLGDKEKAIEYLEAYQKTRPNDERSTQIIAAIKSGNIHIGSNGP